MKIRNLQNIPREKRIKNLFIPNNKDEVLIEADFSQAEGMVVAWKARDKKLIELYKNGADVHSEVGSIVMEMEVSKKTKKERDISKVVVHGSNYGGSYNFIINKLLNDTGLVISPAEAKRRQNIYYQNFSSIQNNYQREIREELKQNFNWLTTPVGFKRQFWGILGDSLYRSAYAFYAQNVVAYVTNKSIVDLAKLGLGEFMLAQIHDAILFSVPKAAVNELAPIIKQNMEQKVIIEGEELTIPVELEVGERWGEMEELLV